MLQIEDRFDESSSNCTDDMDEIVEPIENVGAGKRQPFPRLTLTKGFIDLVRLKCESGTVNNWCQESINFFLNQR